MVMAIGLTTVGFAGEEGGVKARRQRHLGGRLASWRRRVGGWCDCRRENEEAKCESGHEITP